MKKPRKPKIQKPDLHDCAKGRMHSACAQRIVKTMPGGFIA